MAVDRNITKAVSVLVDIIEHRDVREDGIVVAAMHNLGRFGRYARSRLDLLTRIAAEEPQWAVAAIDAIGSIMEDVCDGDDVRLDLDEWKAHSLSMHNELVGITNDHIEQLVKLEEADEELAVRVANCEVEIGIGDDGSSVEDDEDEEDYDDEEDDG